jgi:VCBS repeat-containing protein
LSVTGSSTVQISAINDSPVLAATLVDQSVTAYIPFNYAVPVNTFTDPDLETLSYSVIMADGTGVPPWLSFNTSTQTFSGTPTTSDVGVLDVQVTAKDRANASVADVFRLTVFPDTVAPTVTTFNPTDEAIRITIGSNIVLTFSEVIVKGTGIVVLKTAAGTTIATYDAATSTNLSVSGTSLTINPTADLAYSTEYKVEFAVGTIKDQAGNSYAGTTSYNFATENGIPTATSVTLSAIEDFAKTGTLTGTDPEGSILTFAKFADPSHGTLTINATTGAYVYTPASNYNGTDSFTFKVNDGTVDSTASTVNITVSAVNDSPVASNASVRTAEDSAFTGTLPTATDVEKDPITYSKASDPAHGTASVAAGGSFTYTPSANYNGADSFGYSVGDGQGGLNTYTANVIISAVNDLPTGTVTITGSALQGQALVAANTLADADGLGVISYQWQAAGVNISGATAGSFTLTQTEVGKAVTVIAAYTDGMGTVEGKTSSATALVVDTTAPTVTTFSPIDEASGIAVGGNIVVTFSEAVQRGIGNITLKTSTGTTIATYDATTSSNLSVSGTSLTINPTADLAYSTEYKVEFAAGTIKDQAGNSYAGTTSYNFATENGIPTATSATVSATEDIVKTGILTGTDPEGSALTFAKVADPSHGTVTINATTGAYVYTPASNYNGPDSFAFKVNDGTVDSVASTVSITVAAVNDIPTGSLNITGTASLGQILTATNTLADADGIGTISYQWKAGGIDILGATASIYTLTQAEVGKVIAVAASYTDALGTAESKTSTPTPAVAVNQTATGSTGNESFTSGAGNDSIDGGAGTDVVVYSESLSSFSLTKTNAGFTVTDSTGAAGTDTLQNIERIKFSDGSIALDVGATQPAGQTAMLLGAVLPGKLAFDASKKALLGAAIDLFDQGFSLQTLSGAVMRLPIWDVLTGTATPTNTDIATY